jgi:hypothetical protein
MAVYVASNPHITFRLDDLVRLVCDSTEIYVSEIRTNIEQRTPALLGSIFIVHPMLIIRAKFMSYKILILKLAY